MLPGCTECGGGDDEGLVLLCDECDRPVHALCHDPPVVTPLLGDWICNRCDVLCALRAARRARANEASEEGCA
jgi:hypothetical protein